MKNVRIFRQNLNVSSLVIILAFAIFEVTALKNVAVSIPQAVKIFDTVILQCKYDLEGEPLYTVKWYKGGAEIFRYIPKELPNTLVFDAPGINIDLNRSGPNEVVLIDVRPEVTGRYHCEVSTDAPNFDTQSNSNFIYVVDVPNENPIMEISKESLSFGYKVKANCTSPPSFPAMNITWYINGIKVNETYGKKISLEHVQGVSKSRRPPYMTISYMEKEIDDSIHQGEVVKVQCITTLFNLYRSENLRYIDDNRPQPWPSSVIGVTENISAAIGVPVSLVGLLFIGLCILR